MSLGEFTRTCPECGAIRYITNRRIFTGAKLESPIRICPECGCKVMLLTSKEWCQRGLLSKFLALIPWWGWLTSVLVSGLIVYLLPFVDIKDSVPYILSMMAVMLPILLVFGSIRCNSGVFLARYAQSVLRCRNKQYRASLTAAGKLYGDKLPRFILTPGNRKKLKQLLDGGKTGSFHSGSLFEL